MIPRILSLASPLCVYITLAVLIAALWRERKNLEWQGAGLAIAGLLASFIFLAPVHRLFFDEDIYIAIASNLAHTPVAQITVLGRAGDVETSSYYKEGSAWPVLLSFVFLLTGQSETAAFVMARVFFALAIAGVYQLGRQVLKRRQQAVLAAILFGATPICFWFSPSTGTDIAAALFAVLGMWGLFAGNGMLAAAGFGLAAQTRLELIVLVPLVWLSDRISLKWKVAAAGLVTAEIAHIGWVMSIAPALEKAEKITSAFSSRYAGDNLVINLGYLVNPFLFPVGITAAGIVGLVLCLRRRDRSKFVLTLQMLALFAVYLLFYAGSFDLNPRYAIQILAPLAILAASVSSRPLVIGALLISTALPYRRTLELPPYVQTLAEDHRISVEFASHLQPGDTVLSSEPEIFFNQGRRVMNAVFVSERKEKLVDEIRRGRVIYHAGVRVNRADTVEWRADQWVKSNFELHLIDSREIQGMRIAFYELLL
jgi:hypothetical protein